MFKPEVTKKSKALKRDQKIEELLVEDAKRRQEKKANNDKIFREQQKLSKEQTQKQVSKKSQKFIFGRFEADWQHCLQAHEIAEDTQLTKMTTFELIAMLGFATENQSERALVEEAWTLLNKG